MLTRTSDKMNRSGWPPSPREHDHLFEKHLEWKYVVENDGVIEIDGSDLSGAFAWRQPSSLTVL